MNRSSTTSRIAAFVLLTVGVANAQPGYNGYSGFIANKTCAGCHNGGTKPTVSIKSGPTTLAPGQLGKYTLTVSGALARTEIDVAVADSAATKLTVTPDGTTTKAASNNTEAIPQGDFLVGASADYTFSVSAPVGATSLTIYATGMASDGSGTGGDGVDVKKFTISVVAPPVDAGVDSGPTDAGANVDSGGKPDAGSGADAAPPSDAAVANDAAPAEDSGVIETIDGGATGDAGALPDDSLMNLGTEPGCATTTVTGASRSASLLFAMILAVAARRRKRS